MLHRMRVTNLEVLHLAGWSGSAPVSRPLAGGADGLAEGAPGADVGVSNGEHLDAARSLAEADLWWFVVP